MTLSLFSSRTLIEVRLPSASIGQEGGQAVRDYCAAPPSDHLLLILAPALDYKELRAKWVQAVERAGAVVQARAPDGRHLPAWLEGRLRQKGFQPGPGVAATLAERVEGNLLAAAQEMEKLALLYGEGPLDTEQLARAISDSARFDLFDIPDAALAGDRARMHRVLRGLQAEGTALTLVLWVVAREVRLLAGAAHAGRGGAPALEAYLRRNKVWESRRGAIRALLRRLSDRRLQSLLARCGEADRQIKGLQEGDPWLSLARICDALAGAPADFC
jgi:DNA polymerase-3 subunit delta